MSIKNGVASYFSERIMTELFHIGNFIMKWLNVCTLHQSFLYLVVIISFFDIRW